MIVQLEFVMPDGTEWISGGGLIPGPEQSSYRSEQGDLLGMSSAIYSILLPPNTPFLFIYLPCVMVCRLYIKVSIIITRLNLK